MLKVFVLRIDYVTLHACVVRNMFALRFDDALLRACLVRNMFVRDVALFV